MDILRSKAQEFTHGLPDPVSRFGASILGTDCYQTLILEVDPLASPGCTKLLVSKLLGLAIVCASSTVKVPQMVGMIRSRSVAGISLTGYALETAALVITLAYGIRHGFPFTAFGETVMLAVQNVFVVALGISLRRGRPGAIACAVIAWFAVVGGIVAALLQGHMVTPVLLDRLQASAGALGVLSKIPQIFTLWRQGNSGQLSAYVVFNYLLGSLVRIFTTIQEVDDLLILYCFIASFFLNAILAAQVIYYWNRPSSAKSSLPSSKIEKKYE